MPILKSICIAFAMFSRIPMPRVAWNRENMRYAMAFFPLVGAVAGAAVWGWAQLGTLLGFGAFLRGAGVALWPVLVTGGIHLDGYADTIDALASHAPPEKKQEILKDPHAGAFAIIFVAAYLLGFAALAGELGAGSATGFAGVFVLSRALSGLCVVFLRGAKSSGLAHTFADTAARRASGVVLGLFVLGAAGWMVLWGGAPGAVAVALMALLVPLYRHVAYKQFGGISGDLAGWFLQLVELLGLAGWVLATAITGVVA